MNHVLINTDHLANVIGGPSFYVVRFSQLDSVIVEGSQLFINWTVGNGQGIIIEFTDNKSALEAYRQIVLKFE